MKKVLIGTLGLVLASALVWAAGNAPVITTQPKSQMVNEGESVTFSVVATGGLDLDMIWIKPGTFMMGSPSGELGRSDDEIQHQVTLTKGYWLGKYEVTQAQYGAIMGGIPFAWNTEYSESPERIGDNLPVEYVDYSGAISFCNRLTKQEQSAGRLPEGYEYTLPTKEQWEYACRAGTTTAFNNGTNIPTLAQTGGYYDSNDSWHYGEPCPNLDEVGWYGDNSNYIIHPVGQKKANAWGFYDMHGNVWELDIDYYSGGMLSASYAGKHGGDCNSYAKWCRSSSYAEQVQSSPLGYYDPDRFRGVGFRVALVPTVNVPATLSSITINGNSSVDVGSPATYTCTAKYSDGTTKTVKPTWSISSGGSYASISGGVLTGKVAGTVTIQAKYTDGSVSKTATKNVIVNEVVVKPSITTQPKSQTVNEGSSVTFSVVATGTDLKYQWKKNGTAISGATKSSYTISSATSSDEGSYTVIVSNTAGNVTSSAATLTVNVSVALPKIITQPKSQTVNEGDSVTFSVVAEGGSSSGNADFSVPISGNVNLDMVWINPGTFMMGSPENELGRNIIGGDETQHQVTLTQGYWLGKYEVTQAQYEAVMDSNPSDFKGANLPVDNVTWPEAKSFCEKLTASEKAAGRLPNGYAYTLPTEAQWEYACRAGTTTALNSGKNLTTSAEDVCPNMDEVGWYYYNSGFGTHPVGQKLPNAWGLYDMHGNAWEMCLDWYGDYTTSSVTDPMGPSTGVYCVLRGGGWDGYAYHCRSALRVGEYPSDDYSYFGFRVALVPVQAQASAAASDTLTYQWDKDGNVISGATGSCYTIKNVKASDAGSYTVKVCNSAGCVTSEIATLTVNVLVTLSSITISGNSSVNVGSTATYTCTATYSNGTTKTVTPTWSISSGGSYASISGGVLTGKAAGIVTIKASYTDGGVTKTATKSVTINVAVEGKNFTTPISDSVNLDMVWCPPGTFMMGSPENEIGRGEDEIQYHVTLPQGFWLGKYEVTQSQYEAIMGNNPSCFKGANLPVESVTWDDVMEFCEKLTAVEKLAGRLPEGYEYTLPTEEQWEYACRAGTTTAFNNGTNIPSETQIEVAPCPNLDKVGWYRWNSGELDNNGERTYEGKTFSVGQKKPNAWGLYDMHGNVSEWCLDWYPGFEGTACIMRGGNYFYEAGFCRSACRDGGFSDSSYDFTGFRVALTPVQ